MKKVYATKCAQRWRHIMIHKASFEFSICLFQLQALQMFRKIDFNGICDGQTAKVAVDRKCIANANWAMIPFYYSLATSQPRASCSGFVSFKLHKRPNWILMQKIAIFRCSNLKFIGSVWEKNWHRWQKLSNRSIPVSSYEVMLNTMYYPIIERLL